MKSSDALDRLLAEARRIAEQREKALEGIRQTEAALSEAQRDLAAATEQRSREEFEAAQAPGGLAVASRSAQEAVTKAELRAKSVGLRLQGMEPRLGPLNETLLRAGEAVEAHMKGMLQAEVSDLSSDFDAAVENLIRVVQKAIVLHKFAGKVLEANFVGLGGARALAVFNPLRTLVATFTTNPMKVPGSGLHNGLVYWRGQNTGILGKFLGPEASALDGEMQALQNRVAPISAIVAALRPKT